MSTTQTKQQSEIERDRVAQREKALFGGEKNKKSLCKTPTDLLTGIARSES